MSAYVAGLHLGFTLIIPIGAQNAFVLNRGLAVGVPRVLPTVAAAARCDTVLIGLGAGGAYVLLEEVPVLRELLLLVGAGFLAVLGVRSLRARPADLDDEGAGPPGPAVRTAVGVSLLNPHAILDTVGVIGGSIAAQASSLRPVYAAGAITASWTWFLLLGVGAGLLRGWLTPRVRQVLDQATGVLMLVLAALLLSEL